MKIHSVDQLNKKFKRKYKKYAKIKTTVEDMNKSIEAHINDFELDLVLDEKSEKMTLEEFSDYIKNIKDFSKEIKKASDKVNKGDFSDFRGFDEL